jgi:nucleotide-binding universal stress UspA family protein
MQKKEKTKTYNFLVLIDFSEASYLALKYTISLAKELGGSIHLFHVAGIEKLIHSENALIVKQKMDEEGDKIKEKLKAIVEIIVTDGIDATYEYSFGNDLEQIKEQLVFYNPDITIIGRRKLRLNYRGRITSYLLNKYSGCLLIAGKDKLFSTVSKVSLACNNQTIDKYDLSIVYQLHESVTSPLSIINILKDSDQNQAVQIIDSNEHFKKGKDSLQFAYPVNVNVAEGLIDHVVKEKVELLCVGRSKDTRWILNRFFGRGSTSAIIVEKVDVPILVLGNKK